MILSILNTLRWSLSLGVKFAKVVPFSTFFIIVSTLVSQVAMLVASLLPLKIVILLGSEKVPSYFPTFLIGYGYQTLIGLLSLVTIAFFIVHLVTEKLIEKRIHKATMKLLRMSQKMSLFEGQEKIAQNSYLRFSRALASAVFVALSFVGLAFFYPLIVIVQVVFLLLVIVCLWLLHHFNKDFREKIEAMPGPILNLMSIVGFFIVFLFLVVDFIFFSPPTPLVGIITLLLTRQVMNRLSGVAVDFYLLQRDRLKLDALFFHGKVFMPQLAEGDTGIWSLFDMGMREQWVTSVLSEFKIDAREFTTHWLQVGAYNIFALRVITETEGFLFKLYDENRTSFARHELMLLAENLRGLPSLSLIGSTQVGKYHCIVYHLPLGQKSDLLGYKPALLNFRTSLLKTIVPFWFVSNYQRSKPLLWQRLNVLPFDRLRAVADTDNSRLDLKQFHDKLPEITRILNYLPMRVVNPSIMLDSLWVISDDICLGLEWGQWSLEPIGASWPEQPTELNKLSDLWQELLAENEDLNNISITHVELAALLFAFERDVNRQFFSQALALLPAILERLEAPQKEGLIDS